MGEDAQRLTPESASPPEEDPQPSAGIVVDSQSIKTTGVGGEQRAYEGAKKVKGRKRHLLVDTQGLVLRARLHSAQVQDREGIKLLLKIAPREIVCPSVSLTCGWTPDTPEKTKAPAGCGRFWDGLPRSCDTHRSWLRRR